MQVALVKSGGEFYLLMVDGKSVLVRPDKLIDYFEKGYRHETYEQSMSSAINFISFSPSVVTVSDDEDLEERILGWVGPYPLTTMRLSSISGSVYGIKCIQGDYEEQWEKGLKPALIR